MYFRFWLFDWYISFSSSSFASLSAISSSSISSFCSYYLHLQYYFHFLFLYHYLAHSSLHRLLLILHLHRQFVKCVFLPHYLLLFCLFLGFRCKKYLNKNIYEWDLIFYNFINKITFFFNASFNFCLTDVL